MLPDSDLAILREQSPCDHMMVYNDTARRVAIEFSRASEFVIQPTIFSVGILTNTLSLVVLSGVRMSKVFRVCLVSLALADLCTTVVGLTQILVELLAYCGQVPQGYMLRSLIANNTLYMLFLYCVSTSASIVVFIAFIRNMMYLKPLRARAYFTRKVTRILCGLIALVTLLIYSPTSMYVVWLSCYKETDNAYCNKVNATIPNLETVANGYLYFVTALYIPIMLLAYIANFICIRVSLMRSAQKVSRLTAQNQETQRTDTVTRITKTLSLILILDVVCTLPSLMQSIGVLVKPEDIHEKNNLFFEVIDVVAEIFLALRPTYNFWIYIFQRPEFRQRLRCVLYKTFYPCFHHEWCPCSDLFSQDKLQNQSQHLTSSSAEVISRRNANNMAMSPRLTPPTARHHKLNACNNNV